MSYTISGKMFVICDDGHKREFHPRPFTTNEFHHVFFIERAEAERVYFRMTCEGAYAWQYSFNRQPFANRGMNDRDTYLIELSLLDDSGNELMSETFTIPKCLY